MPAIPALVMAGGAIGSSYLAKKTAEDASEQSPDQRAATGAQTALANTQRTQGQQLMSTGMPAIENTLNYYRTLMGRGGRSAGQALVAPQAQNIANTYRGAARGVQRAGVVGGVRDQALADMKRDEAGQTSRLLSGVAGGAAEKSGALGQSLIGPGAGLEEGAQGAYADLSHGAQRRSEFGFGAGAEAGAGFGGLLAQLANAYGGKKSTPAGGGGGGGGPLIGGYATLPPAFGSTTNPVPFTQPSYVGGGRTTAAPNTDWSMDNYRSGILSGRQTVPGWR